MGKKEGLIDAATRRAEIRENLSKIKARLGELRKARADSKAKAEAESKKRAEKNNPEEVTP